MSSSTLDTIAGYLSHIQQRYTFTRERFLLMRRYFFQSVGLFICALQCAILVYHTLKYLFAIIFWIPLKLIELFIPKTTNYNIIMLLLWFCSIISFSIAKYSHKKIGKRHSFIFVFIALLILQSLFIIRPIARSIHEQRIRENNLKVESNVEDEQDNNLIENASPIVINPQQENYLVDYFRQFSSKLLENFSKFFRKKLEQIHETEQRKSPYNYSSIYTAFTDLNCYDYTKLVYQNYNHFLHTYRSRTPFPIYLSILKTNGPTCHIHNLSASCAIRSKLKEKLFRFIRFWMIIGISTIICIFIYNHFRYRQRADVCKQLSNKESIPKTSNHQPLDKELEDRLRLWLNQQQTDINESCRMAFNRTYSQQYVSN